MRVEEVLVVDVEGSELELGHALDLFDVEMDATGDGRRLTGSVEGRRRECARVFLGEPAGVQRSVRLSQDNREDVLLEETTKEVGNLLPRSVPYRRYIRKVPSDLDPVPGCGTLFLTGFGCFHRF